MPRHSPPASFPRGSPFGGRSPSTAHMHGSEEVTTSPLKRKIAAAEADEREAKTVATVAAANARIRPDTITDTRRALHEPMGAPHAAVDSDPDISLKPARNAWDGLFDMTQDELCNYLGSIQADEEFIQNIVAHQIDGQQWGAMFTTADDKILEGEGYNDTIGAFASDKTTKIVKIKIRTHLTLALQGMLLSNKVEEREEKQDAAFKIKDLYSMKLPELPKGESAGGRLSSKQVKAYKELLQSTINIIKREYCEKVEIIFLSPTGTRLGLCLQDMDMQEQQLDELLGQTLMKSSQETTMRSIISMGYHQQDITGESKYSGLCILQVIFEAITKLTGPKLGATLKQLFEPLAKPSSDIRSLEVDYRHHNDSISQLEATDVKIDPIIQTFLLQQMTSTVANDPKNTMLLGIPMSTIVRDGFQDHAGMVGIVEQAIMEFTNDPAQNGSKGKPTAPGGPRGKAALAAARATIAAARPQYTPEEYAKQPCVDHRERELTGNICVDQAKCKRDHTCTGVVCYTPCHGQVWQVP